MVATPAAPYTRMSMSIARAKLVPSLNSFDSLCFVSIVSVSPLRDARHNYMD